jgi:predicted metal-dependent HD superfamily phosphohydrolase
VPEQDFLAGRLALLTELADREIFRTAKGRHLTSAARANLGAEINALIGRLDVPVEGSDV